MASAGIEPLLLVATGFLLGMGHSFDPDHVVAVSTLLSNSPSLRKSVISATAWGAGHSATVLLVGVIVLALRVSIPSSIVSLFQFAAGLMLIVLGLLVLRPVVGKAVNLRWHRNGSDVDLGRSSASVGNAKSNALIPKSIFTGVVQGLAGSAALMLVILTTVDSVMLGFVFILVFGVGVILGMVCIACLISSLISFTASRLERVHEKIAVITGFISLGLGIFLVVQMLIRFL